MRQLFASALACFQAVVALDQAALAQGTPAMTLFLTSAAFTAGGAIPKRYTCEGDDVWPSPGVPDTFDSMMCSGGSHHGRRSKEVP